ncbi:MAG TPA: hypothetical protein VJ694_05315, partial [Patescibacteria group bacterium]|nr:hypothetical protein [Patescibacteria group bacterium]
MPPKPAMPGPARPASPLAGKALIGAACLAVGLVAGYGAGRVSTGTPVNPLRPSEAQKTVPQDTDALTRLRESGQLPPAATEATTMSGSVVAVEGSRLTFDAELTSFDPA